MGKGTTVRVGKSSQRVLRSAIHLTLLAFAIQLAQACGSSDDDDDASGGTAGTRADGGTAGSGNAGGTRAEGGAAGEAGGGSGNASGSSGKGGTSGKGGSSGGFAGNGAGGCEDTCSGCTDSELTVHCSFGSREVANDTDNVAELCALAETEFAGVGGAGATEGVAGGGGASSDYCDDYVERGTEILGCDFGCLAKETWTKLGTCTINGECCILESYQSCE